jgi:RNA polymerase sigma factor (sigma-70 family)
MNTEALNDLVSRLHHSAASRTAAGQSDGALLTGFVERRDAAAFEALVRRHGPMVLGVCERVLPCRQDAEDAFQAVFLVLVRKASSVSPRELVGNWLYGVAHQTAVRVRARNHTRSTRERQVPMMPEPAAGPAADWNDLRLVLDEELSRLPDHYRAVVVLCDVEGRTRKDAARHLRCPEGSVSSRLARARRMLANRLARRGVALSAAAAAGLMSRHAAAHVPAGLVNDTLRTAAVWLPGSVGTHGPPAGPVPPNATSIAAGVLGAMSVKESLVTGVLASLFVLGSTTCCLVVHQLQAGQGPPAVTWPAAVPAPQEADAAPSPEDLVRQLNDDNFRKREAAERALIAIGAKAIPAVRAGLKSPEPELGRRCERLLPLIRHAELIAFAKAFGDDSERKAGFDHPVWRRYVGMVGDSRPSRELFGEIVRHPDWLRNLDDAEGDRAKAGDIYRAGVREVGKRQQANLTVRFLIPIWPCDQPEETAYLLLLGSYPGTDPKFPLSYSDLSDRQFADGESRVRHGRGLGLAFQGKRLAIDPKKRDRCVVVDDAGGNAAESGRVMLLLLAHWLERRNCWPVVAEHLAGLNADQQKQLLPFARRVIADREAPVLCRATWVSPVRRFGGPTDAALLTPLFADTSGVDWPSTTRFGDGPGNLINQAQVREVAIGSAIFLRGRDPIDFGFTGLANQRPPKRRDDDIHSTLFTVQPVGPKEEKEKTLAAAIKWLAQEAKQDEPPAPPRKLGRVAEPPGKLQAELARLDKVYRHGTDAQYREFEAEAEALLKQYPQPENQARILFHVAHVAAQGGIMKQVERVRAYGARMLGVSQDPVERGTMYSYLASAAEADPAVKAFADRRRAAAEPLLRGYAELLAQELPERKSERPPLGPVREGPDDGDPNARGEAQARAAAMLEAYRQAVFTEDLVFRRDTLVGQLRWLYRPNLHVHGRGADGPDELRALAAARLTSPAVADELVARILGPDDRQPPKAPTEPQWAVVVAKDDLVEIAVGSRQGVKVGDTLRITRGGPKATGVAKIRVVCVDEADAVGQVMERGDQKVEPGDGVGR